MDPPPLPQAYKDHIRKQGQLQDAEGWASTLRSTEEEVPRDDKQEENVEQQGRITTGSAGYQSGGSSSPAATAGNVVGAPPLLPGQVAPGLPGVRRTKPKKMSRKEVLDDLAKLTL